MSKINTWDCVVVETVDNYRAVCGVDSPLYFIGIDYHRDNKNFEHCDPYASELTSYAPLERYSEAIDNLNDFNTSYDCGEVNNLSIFSGGLLEYDDGFVQDQGI